MLYVYVYILLGEGVCWHIVKRIKHVVIMTP